MFSSASSTEKRGSTPMKTAASPWARWRSTSSVGRPDALRSAVARLTATVVVPTPPLAPRIATARPIIGSVIGAGDAIQRRVHLVEVDRLGDPLADAQAHRLEHRGRVERARDDDDAGRREEALDVSDLARQPKPAPHVEHERIRPLRARRVRGLDIGERDRVRRAALAAAGPATRSRSLEPTMVTEIDTALPHERDADDKGALPAYCWCHYAATRDTDRCSQSRHCLASRR